MLWEVTGTNTDRLWRRERRWVISWPLITTSAALRGGLTAGTIRACAPRQMTAACQGRAAAHPGATLPVGRQGPDGAEPCQEGPYPLDRSLWTHC